MKIVAIIGAVIVVIITALYFFFYKSVSGVGDSAHKEYKIDFPDLKETIYAEASMWGLTGDHMQILISRSTPTTGRKYDSTVDYVFYEPTIYYKQETDTLTIYSASPSNVPKKFDSSVRVKQVQINGYDEAKKYEKNYEVLGLKKITVYDK
jgi:hypothetical protein